MCVFLCACGKLCLCRQSSVYVGSRLLGCLRVAACGKQLPLLVCVCVCAPIQHDVWGDDGLAERGELTAGGSTALQVGEIGFKGTGLINSRHQRGKAAAVRNDDDDDF